MAGRERGQRGVGGALAVEEAQRQARGAAARGVDHGERRFVVLGERVEGG
ncbi:MAG TPA: hypothetical protein VNI55_00925 [Gaiellaceae bacterium]|nr:hypothetical protein [Gaiellaceae bacterium]